MSHLTKTQIDLMLGHDPTVGDDSNYRHLAHLLKGYRAAVDGATKDACDYVPGSARANSWLQGFMLAKHDLARRARRDRRSR
jgi:ribosome modulation factor